MRNIGALGRKRQVTPKVTLGRNFAVGHSEKSESSVKMAKFFVSQGIWSYYLWGGGSGRNHQLSPKGPVTGSDHTAKKNKKWGGVP